MSVSGSEYSEPPESVSPLNEPTGSGQEEAVRENSSDNGTPNLARKWHGSSHGGDNPDNAESSLPEKARKGSQHESLESNESPTDTGEKEPEDLGSVHLRLEGFPVLLSQDFANVALSVLPPVHFLPSEQLATSPFWSRTVRIPFSQLFGTLKMNLVKYQFQPMFLLCQVLPTRSTLCGHVVSN